MNSGLQVLFEDEYCLAVSKRAGQFTQGTWAPPGETTLEQDVRSHLDPANPASVYVGIVHRLDRPVSGVLLWAKTSKAARRLSRQFERRQVVKEYWALVEETQEFTTPPDAGPASGGPVPCEEAIWTDWLTGAGVAGVVRIVESGTEGARIATTRFQLADARGLPPGCAWLRLWPETGRTHQLRVQAAKRGLPILGDSTYGASRPFPQGIALHARSLRARHPMLQVPLILTAPLPASWGEQESGFVDVADGA